ncbi:hypothetical protein FIBSPDRAFT_331881 [Athelia psychrophila]|uniref:Uncharacterized protein n=1 Tax=Athelia psychrophila TaxID=1759441 RepID=A0A167WE87_9AGAM|nr:hypothetical protein FIBSPDRAFT_331881 [Fibularhizoctonia sp. CBS 109695]
MSCRQRIVGPRYIQSHTFGIYGLSSLCSNCITANIRPEIIKCPRVVQEREIPSLTMAMVGIAVPEDTVQCSSCHMDTRRGYWVCVQCKKAVNMHCEICNSDLELDSHDGSHTLVYKAKHWGPGTPRAAGTPQRRASMPTWGADTPPPGPGIPPWGAPF